MNDPSSRTRTLVFIFSALLDLAVGSFFLLTWLEVLPINLAGWGLTRSQVGMLGGAMALSGVVVLAIYLGKLNKPTD